MTTKTTKTKKTAKAQRKPVPQDVYDIDITASLLKKSEDELTPLEKEAVSVWNSRMQMREDAQKRANTEIKENCKLLCSKGSDSYFVVSPGWTSPIKKFCYQLEALNIYYKKYGLRVTSTQNKEKYGTFRCYYDVERLPRGLYKAAYSVFDILDSLVQKCFDFSIKQEIVIPSRTVIEWNKCTEDDFKDNKIRYLSPWPLSKRVIWDDNSFRVKAKDIYRDDAKGNPKISAIECNIVKLDKDYNEELIDLDEVHVFKEVDGKHYYASKVYHCGSLKPVATKHKLMYRVHKLLGTLASCLRWSSPHHKHEDVMMEDFIVKADELYSKCEQECYSSCERCGRDIGTDYSPRCQMSGWISYVCEDCAKADGGQYIKDNAYYIEGKKLSKKVQNI